MVVVSAASLAQHGQQVRPCIEVQQLQLMRGPVSPLVGTTHRLISLPKGETHNYAAEAEADRAQPRALLANAGVD